MRDVTSEKIVKNVVAELTKVRKAQGISHQTLSDQTGISRSSISYIENFKNIPTILTCTKIARALGLKVSDVFAKFEN